MIVNILKLTITPMAFAGIQMLFGAHKFIPNGDYTWLRDFLSTLQLKLSLPPFDDNALLVKAASLDKPLGLEVPNFIFFHTLGALKVFAIITIWLPSHFRTPLPRWFAYSGLITSCIAAAYGHQQTDTPIAPPIIMGVLTALTWALDKPTSGSSKMKSR